MTIFNYTVNYVDIIICAIFLLFGFVGWKKGIFITVINFIRYVVGLFICVFVSNRFTTFVYDNFVKERVIDILNDKIVTSNNLDEVISNLQGTIDSFPKFMMEWFNISSIKLSSDDIVLDIANNIFGPAVQMLVKIGLFAITFILFFAITGIIISVIQRKNNKDKREKNSRPTKKAIRTIDSIFGGVFGILKGALIVFLFVSCVTYFMTVQGVANSHFFVEANNSQLYNYILDYNPFNVITEGII